MTRRAEKSKRNVVKDLLLGFFLQFRDEILLVAAGTVAAFVRAMAITVESGHTGLLFSFGRARRTLEPGWHPLIPFLQSVRKVPTRSRTLDLPAQRVVTFVGLVYHVDANLVYRITDVRRALIEIDDLELGMRRMLALGVQEVVRASERADLMRPGKLDREVERNLAQRLAPWGVEVERAGLTSITPSKQTLRITQIGRVTAERRTMLAHIGQSTNQACALGLMGTRVRPVRRHLHMRQQERRARRVRRLRQALMRNGWTAVQIKQAGLALRSRSTTGGKLKAEDKTRPTGRERGQQPGQRSGQGPGQRTDKRKARARSPRSGPSRQGPRNAGQARAARPRSA